MIETLIWINVWEKGVGKGGSKGLNGLQTGSLPYNFSPPYPQLFLVRLVFLFKYWPFFLYQIWKFPFQLLGKIKFEFHNNIVSLY